MRHVVSVFTPTHLKSIGIPWETDNKVVRPFLQSPARSPGVRGAAYRRLPSLLRSLELRKDSKSDKRDDFAKKSMQMSIVSYQKRPDSYSDPSSLANSYKAGAYDQQSAGSECPSPIPALLEIRLETRTGALLAWFSNEWEKSFSPSPHVSSSYTNSRWRNIGSVPSRFNDREGLTTKHSRMSGAWALGWWSLSRGIDTSYSCYLCRNSRLTHFIRRYCHFIKGCMAG